MSRSEQVAAILKTNQPPKHGGRIHWGCRKTNNDMIEVPFTFPEMVTEDVIAAMHEAIKNKSDATINYKVHQINFSTNKMMVICEKTGEQIEQFNS